MCHPRAQGRFFLSPLAVLREIACSFLGHLCVVMKVTRFVFFSLCKSGQSAIAGDELPKSPVLQEVQLKFLLTGLLSGLPPPPFAIRMCPPLTTKNIKMYQPLLAVGEEQFYFGFCASRLSAEMYLLVPRAACPLLEIALKEVL